MHWPGSAAPFCDNPAAGLRALIFALLESYERATGFFSILVDYWSVVIRESGEHGQLFLARGSHFYDDALALLSEVIEAGQEDGAFRIDIDAVAAARIIVAGIEGLRLQRALSLPEFNLREAVAAFADMIIRDLTPR